MKNKILIGLTCLFVLICTVGCANTKENTSVKNDNVMIKKLLFQFQMIK